MSFLWHVKYVYYSLTAEVCCLPQELDMAIWTWAKNELAIQGVSGADELCDDCEGGGSNGKEEQEHECDLD
jgi:hypothetical protein